MAVDDEFVSDLSDQGFLNVFLDSLSDDQDGSLAGFVLSISGETTDEFPVPPSLELPRLREAVSMRADADRFTIPKGLFYSTFRCVRRLIETDELIFLGPVPAGGSSDGVTPGKRSLIPIDDLMDVLKKTPLALQLAITKSKKDSKPRLSALIAKGTAAELNSGIAILDRDDTILLGHLPTSRPDRSLFHVEPVNEAWDPYLGKFYAKLF